MRGLRPEARTSTLKCALTRSMAWRRVPSLKACSSDTMCSRSCASVGTLGVASVGAASVGTVPPAEGEGSASPPSAPPSAPPSPVAAAPVWRAARPSQPLLRVVPFVVPAFTPYNWAHPAEETDYRAYVRNNRGDKYLAWCRMHACANAARTAWCEAGGRAACRNECARDANSTCRAADLSITVPPTVNVDAAVVDAAAAATEHKLARQRRAAQRRAADRRVRSSRADDKALDEYLDKYLAI